MVGDFDRNFSFRGHVVKFVIVIRFGHNNLSPDLSGLVNLTTEAMLGLYSASDVVMVGGRWGQWGGLDNRCAALDKGGVGGEWADGGGHADLLLALGGGHGAAGLIAKVAVTGTSELRNHGTMKGKWGGGGGGRGLRDVNGDVRHGFACHGFNGGAIHDVWIDGECGGGIGLGWLG